MNKYRSNRLLICVATFTILFLCQCKSKSEKVEGAFNNKQSNKVYIDPNYSEQNIDPATYTETGKVYTIFIHNETANSITANEKVTIKPNESYLFKMPDTMGIALNNGIQFFIGETVGLEVIDNNIQVAGLGGEWLDKLNVPDSADWAFSILNPGEGDPIPE